MLRLLSEKPGQGDVASEDRQRGGPTDSLVSDPSAVVSFETLDADSCSSDRADSRLGSPKNFLSSSDGDEHSKLFISGW